MPESTSQRPMGSKRAVASKQAINTRGLEQLKHAYEQHQPQAAKLLPSEHEELGDLVAIDGSLIQATLFMTWADYRDGSKKAKVHVGFDVNHSISAKLFPTDGKGDERSFVGVILEPGQTGIMDRYYQCHKNFDAWQTEGRHFVCRITANTRKTPYPRKAGATREHCLLRQSYAFGDPGVNQTQKPVRPVGYRIHNVEYWIATDRHDLSAEQIASIHKLSWHIEKSFAWRKRHLKVYHLIARSEYGLMVQILAGLITYLLLAIYCHEQYQEKVSIRRVRQLRIKIQNELRDSGLWNACAYDLKEQHERDATAKT